jgi:Flp pilus assembly protein TadG
MGAVAPSLQQRFLRDRRGAAALEFALVLPLLVFILVSALQVGVIAMSSSALDNALFQVTRQIRTGQSTAPSSADELEDQICSHAGVLMDCQSRLTVSVQRFTRFSDANAIMTQPPDGAFNSGGPSDIIVVKADFRLPIVIPFIAPDGSGVSDGEVTLASRTAFKNEPYG